MTTLNYRQAKILHDFKKSAATIEDLARAWASIKGKLEIFDKEKDMNFADVEDGVYLGYLCEMEEALKRATDYARERKA